MNRIGVNLIGRFVDRREEYFVQAAKHRAGDSDEFHRRYHKGLQVQREVQKSAEQRRDERELAATPAPVIPLKLARA